MRPRSNLETVYLGLAILGTVLPLAAFLPWLMANGLHLPRFAEALFANRIAAFFGWDVIVSAIVVLVAVAAESDGLSTAQRTGVEISTLLVGVSLGLPLLLYFRERAP